MSKAAAHVTATLNSLLQHVEKDTRMRRAQRPPADDAVV